MTYTGSKRLGLSLADFWSLTPGEYQEMESEARKHEVYTAHTIGMSARGCDVLKLLEPVQPKKQAVHSFFF